MAVSIYKLPEWTEFQQKGFYADYEERINATINAENISKDLWNVFVANELTELQDIDDFTLEKEDIDLSKAFIYKNAGMDHHAKSLFKKNLIEFFGTYLHKHSSGINAGSGTGNLTSKFRDYLLSSERPNNIRARENMVPIFWAWELLLQIMKESQSTALNKANASVLFSLGEELAVNKMGQVEFELQTGDSDYETIKKNMDAQQESENHRNWRSIIGKSTSQYQNDVQTATDARTQFSQLATKFIQEMESIASAITRIG